MNTIAFHTNAFPIAPEGDFDYCNGQPGSAVASWLRSSVAEHGFSSGEPAQEDYGWGFWIDAPTPIWVAVSHLDEDEEDAILAPPSWVVSVSHECSIFNPWQWFHQREGNTLAEQVANVVRTAVTKRKDLVVESF